MVNLIYHAGTAGKIKQKEATRAVCHTFRKTKDKFKSHSNKEINKDMTKYNIDFKLKGYEGKTPDEIAKERIENEYRGKREIRKDAVILREIIANPSADVFEGMTIEEQREKMQQFVKDAMPWFRKEFGEKNVVGASAHFDETTPHVHFVIMPMTKDGRISQKDFFKGPGDLKRQHREFREHMRSKLWAIAEENKYEDFDDVDLPKYKANAKAIEAKRKEQQKAIVELSQDKDLRQEAFDKVVEEYAGLGVATIHKLMREELEEKQEELKDKEIKMLLAVDKKNTRAEERLAIVNHMYELKQREDERNTKEKPTSAELREILEKETDGRFSVLLMPKTGEPVLAEIQGKKARRISEVMLVKELTTQDPDGRGGVFFDLKGNEAISYVLGHYNSDVAKTRSEAHMDGLKAISEVHHQMAWELHNEKQR